MTNARIKNLKFLHCITNNFYSDGKGILCQKLPKVFSWIMVLNWKLCLVITLGILNSVTWNMHLPFGTNLKICYSKIEILIEIKIGKWKFYLEMSHMHRIYLHHIYLLLSVSNFSRKFPHHTFSVPLFNLIN